MFGLDHVMLPMETAFDLIGRDPTLTRKIGSALGLPVSPGLSPMTTA